MCDMKKSISLQVLEKALLHKGLKYCETEFIWRKTLMALNFRKKIGSIFKKKEKPAEQKKPVVKKPTPIPRPVEEVLASRAIKFPAFVKACKAKGFEPGQYFMQKYEVLSQHPKVLDAELSARAKAKKAGNEFNEAAFYARVMIKQLLPKKQQ